VLGALCLNRSDRVLVESRAFDKKIRTRGDGASRVVRAAKAERRLWVPKRSAAADN
jgi:hypothetical protein